MKNIIFLIIGIICFFYFSFLIKEPFQTPQKNAFCLITKEPHDIWLKFLNGFKNYDIFVAVDIKIDINKYNYPNIKFIIIEDDECKNNGYFNSSFLIPKTPISWDKALYYFCEINKIYENVWFCEDDVYIPSEVNIKNLDENYKDDLICCPMEGNTTIKTNNDGIIREYCWSITEKYFEIPWYQGLIAITRIPKKLLEKISEFTKKHKQLDFLEVVIPTLGGENKINIITPIELIEVTCCNKLDPNNLDKNKIYHPIKDVNIHAQIREGNY
jgi:hypothetical protein